MTLKKWLRLTIGVVFASVFFILIFRNINFQDVKVVFYSANIFPILMAIVAFFIGYSFRIERWKQMLTIENPNLKWRDCSGAFMVSVAANNVLPFRAGDLIRAFGFIHRLKVSIQISVISLFVERLLDLLMVVIFLGIALSYFGMNSSRFFKFGGGLLFFCALAILLILLLPSIFKPIVLSLTKILCHIFPKTIGEKILAEINKGFEALECMSNGSTMAKLILLSFLVWIAEGGVFWLAAKSLPSLNNPDAAWLALPVCTLATIIPSTPGYIGTFDFFAVESMVSVGNLTTASAAYAILIHSLLWFPATLTGGLYMLINPAKYKEHIKAIHQ